MEIQTITQRSNFKQYFQEYFYNHNTYVKTQSGNIEVSYLGFFDGITALRFPVALNNINNCLLFSRVHTNIGVALLNLFSQKDNDVFYYSPQKFQIISKPRKETRQGVNIHNQNIVYLHEIMSENIMIESLNQKKSKINDIKEVLMFQKKDFCRELKIFFINEDPNDPRMKYFKRGNSKIEIRDSGNIDKTKSSMYEYYVTNILPRDKDLKVKKEITSEVSIPLLWNKSIPFGYIQVNASKNISVSQVTIIKRMAALAENMAKELKLFYNINQRFILSDISPGGFSIVFSDRRFVKVFKENNLISVDMHLPGKINATILASVRHLDILSTGFVKVGFMNVKMDDINSEYYKKFLSSLD